MSLIVRKLSPGIVGSSGREKKRRAELKCGCWGCWVKMGRMRRDLLKIRQLVSGRASTGACVTP